MTRQEVLAWLEKVPEDEPIFCLRAKDDIATHALRCWMREASAMGVAEEKIDGAKGFLIEFSEWRHENPDKCKLPD